MLLSGNTVKAGFLNPSFRGAFRIKATFKNSGDSEANIPLRETPEIVKILADVKEGVSSASLFEL